MSSAELHVLLVCLGTFGQAAQDVYIQKNRSGHCDFFALLCCAGKTGQAPDLKIIPAVFSLQVSFVKLLAVSAEAGKPEALRTGFGG